MDAPYQQLGSSAGYEIGRRGTELSFSHRATRGPALVAWIGGGLAGMAAVHAVLWPSLALADQVDAASAWIASGVLVPVSLGLFAVARAGYRAYRRRRDCPVESVPGYRADLTAGVLRLGDRDVAALADIAVDTPMNIGDSTQGAMRWVRLTWPGGRARVYSAGAAEAQRVATELQSLLS